MRLEIVITHQFSLSEGTRGYEVFDKKLDNIMQSHFSNVSYYWLS